MVEARDATDRANSPGSQPLLSDSEEEEATFNPSHQGRRGLPGSVKLDMPSPGLREDEELQENRKAGRIPGEPLKTLLSAIFLGTGFLATTASLAFTHERVPETEPLPDLFLDNIQYQNWGLDVSEILLMLNTFTAVFVILMHSHRTIILRRIWLVLGLLYYYRALTMCVTVLPKADQTYTCMPKTPRNETTAMMYVQRVLTIISGGGLSINGKHVFCGDYIFSGHTMTLTLGYLAIKQCKSCSSVHFTTLRSTLMQPDLTESIFQIHPGGSFFCTGLPSSQLSVASSSFSSQGKSPDCWCSISMSLLLIISLQGPLYDWRTARLLCLLSPLVSAKPFLRYKHGRFQAACPDMLGYP